MPSSNKWFIEGPRIHILSKWHLYWFSLVCGEHDNGYMIQRCCTPAYQHTASWSLITSVRYCVDCIACRSRDEWSLTLRVWHTNRLYSLRQQHRRRPTYLSADIQLVSEHGRRHLRSSSYRTLLLNLLTYLLTYSLEFMCMSTILNNNRLPVLNI